MPLSTPLYTQHSREWRSNRFVYPVISRRSHGLSIGINLNPDKACNFDCIYCSVDRTTPGRGREVDLGLLRSELRGLLELALSGGLFAQEPFASTPPALRRLNDVAFSGDGEPTAALEFGRAVRVASEVIDELQADCRLVLITNATLLGRPEVAAALDFLDRHHGQIWAKLDAGTEDYYRRIDRTDVPFARVLTNLARAAQQRPIVIQSLFMRVEGSGPAADELDAYVQRLVEIRDGGGRIELVQVYTTARSPAVSTVTPLPAEAIDGIVALLVARGIPAEGFYGPH